METNLPPAGGDVRPYLSSPQQRGEPLGRSAQVSYLPLVMAMNCSSRGGDAWPYWLSPQQAGEPSGRRAQV